jgi:hypothetical protein
VALAVAPSALIVSSGRSRKNRSRDLEFADGRKAPGCIIVVAVIVAVVVAAAAAVVVAVVDRRVRGRGSSRGWRSAYLSVVGM